jgi:hypothetical protein
VGNADRHPQHDAHARHRVVRQEDLSVAFDDCLHDAGPVYRSIVQHLRSKLLILDRKVETQIPEREQEQG